MEIINASAGASHFLWVVKVTVDEHNGVQLPFHVSPQIRCGKWELSDVIERDSVTGIKAIHLTMTIDIWVGPEYSLLCKPNFCNLRHCDIVTDTTDAYTYMYVKSTKNH